MLFTCSRVARTCDRWAGRQRGTTLRLRCGGTYMSSLVLRDNHAKVATACPLKLAPLLRDQSGPSSATVHPLSLRADDYLSSERSSSPTNSISHPALADRLLLDRAKGNPGFLSKCLRDFSAFAESVTSIGGTILFFASPTTLCTRVCHRGLNEGELAHRVPRKTFCKSRARWIGEQRLSMGGASSPQSTSRVGTCIRRCRRA